MLLEGTSLVKYIFQILLLPRLIRGYRTPDAKIDFTFMERKNP